MTKILFISDNPNELKLWHETLSKKYSLVIINNWEDYHSSHKKFGPDYLAIIDASMLTTHKNIFPVLKNSGCKIIIVANKWPDAKQVQIVAEGASGYCEKSINPNLISIVIKRVMDGEIWINRLLMIEIIKLLNDKKNKKIEPQGYNSFNLKTKNLALLSERQSEVAKLIAKGDDNKKISSELDITERTVKAHLSSIFKKLEISDRIHLVLFLNGCFEEEKENTL